MIDRDWEVDSKVDKHNLDMEWEELPGVYQYWAERCGDAKAEKVAAEERLKTVRTETKREIELTRAEVDLSIRDSPVLFGLPGDKKPSENMIASRILKDDVYQKTVELCDEKISEAVSNLVEAVRNEEIMIGAKNMMSIKKAAVEGLANLYLRDYYPKIDQAFREEKMNERREDIRKGLVKRNTKKKRIKRTKGE